MSDFEKMINASDLIEWIMETYPDWCVGAVRSIVDHVGALPSAQPKVVRCKDCKHYEIYQLKKDGTDDRRYKPSYCTLLRHNFKPDWYCADGERKGEER